MPNINAAINEQIRRLARREITANTKVVKRATAHYRRDIAALKRLVADLAKSMRVLQKQQPQGTSTVEPASIEGLRFRADGLKTHRAKLGLTAEQYGKLVGASPLTIYNWEGRKAKPRKSMLPKLLAVRGIGKREAMQRLGLTTPKTGKAATPVTGARKKGKFKQTGEQLILSLLKGRKALVTSQINQAWKKEGRGGTADVALGLMVKARKLMRTKVKGQRGSEYRTA